MLVAPLSDVELTNKLTLNKSDTYEVSTGGIFVRVWLEPIPMCKPVKNLNKGYSV